MLGNSGPTEWLIASQGHSLLNGVGYSLVASGYDWGTNYKHTTQLSTLKTNNAGLKTARVTMKSSFSVAET